MTFTVNLTKDDYRAFQRYCRRRFHHTQWSILVMLAIVEVMTWHGQKPDATWATKIGSALALPIVFLALFGVLMLVKWIMAKVTRSSFQQPTGRHDYEITDALFKERNDFGSTETTLDRIKTIGETKHHVFVILTNGLGYIIPRRESTSHELDQVLALLKTAPHG